MTDICIIRHGETEWNALFKIQGRADIPLNKTGRSQAAVTANHLADESWNAIYSSPLIRAFETARTISKAVDVSSVTTDPDLVERDCGAADGMLIEERRRVYPDWSNIPDAENLDNLRARAVNILTRISERHEGERIIVVSHGCFIMEILEAFSGGEINGRKTRLKNLSMTLLRKDSEWSIPWYNRSAMEAETTSAS